MEISPLAGKPAPLDLLVDVPRLITAYYNEIPDPSVPEQRVSAPTDIAVRRSVMHSTNGIFWQLPRRFASIAHDKQSLGRCISASIRMHFPFRPAPLPLKYWRQMVSK